MTFFVSHRNLYSLPLDLKLEHCSERSGGTICVDYTTKFAKSQKPEWQKGGTTSLPNNLRVLLLLIGSRIFIHLVFYHLHLLKTLQLPACCSSAVQHLTSAAFHKLHIWGNVNNQDLTYFLYILQVVSNTCTVSFRSATSPDEELALRCNLVSPEKQQGNLSRW